MRAVVALPEAEEIPDPLRLGLRGTGLVIALAGLALMFAPRRALVGS